VISPAVRIALVALDLEIREHNERHLELGAI
jgi:hypothetical protein